MTLRIPASLRVYNSAGPDPVTVEFNGSDLPAYNARDAQGQIAPQEATLQSGGNDGKGTGGNTDILHVTTDVYHDGAMAKLMYQVSIEGTLPNCTTQDLPIVSFNWGSFSDYASPYYVLRQRSPADYTAVYGGGPTALPFISPQMVTRLWVAGPWGGGADRTHAIAEVRIRTEAEHHEAEKEKEKEKEREQESGKRCLRWRGIIPAQKWTNFYMKVLTRFAASPDLKLEVSFEVPIEGDAGQTKADETRSGLKELGLGDDVTIS